MVLVVVAVVYVHLVHQYPLVKCHLLLRRMIRYLEFLEKE